MISKLDADILTTLGEIGSIGTAIGTLLLVFIFWKTIKHLDETVKLNRIQSTYRFRPWVGPIGPIEHMSTTSNGQEKFHVTIRNYGELPAASVVAKFITRPEPLKKEILSSKDITSFNLGPLLPNMEKKYWFFVDSDQIVNTKNGKNQLFTLLYFLYEHHGGTSGYGLISRFDETTNSFVHTDMWVD